MIKELLGTGLRAVVRSFVGTEANDFVRRVKVDRTLTPMQVIDATGRTKYVDDRVVATMPDGKGEWVDVVFSKLKRHEYSRPGYMSNDELERAFDLRGLTPDPRAQTKVNEEDPALADDHPNGTFWKNGDSYFFIAFGRWNNGRCVFVIVICRLGSFGRWNKDCWIAGVRKALSTESS